MKRADSGPPANRVKALRVQRGWSQNALACQAGVSRAAVSAIEAQRLTPSVLVAMSLATVFECRVEELFLDRSAEPSENSWAWPPAQQPCRFWHARIGNRTLRYPVEPTASGLTLHDGTFRDGTIQLNNITAPESTLVLASCDPAAGLLADEVGRTSAFRLLVLPRASRPALDLLRRGLVHVAGVHLAASDSQEGNAEAVRSVLGPGYSLLSVASWQEGLALGSGVTMSTVGAVLRSRLRWVGREPGSGARQCQDEVLQGRASPRRSARDHRGVIEAIRCGWADVGVCVRLVSDEAGLRFLSVREEAYQLCYPTALENDPRLRALLQAVRSRSYGRSLSEMPGYDCRHLGESIRVG